ncbi:glycosyltransferase family 4 protein [Oenococcus sp. UCMA 16435]|nr:glycosyltransferase family 4 protein [Oenococcus sp. UCMA 16435]
MKKKKLEMLMISNLYPSSDFPEYGTFVFNFCSEMKQRGWRIKIITYKKSKGSLAVKFFNYFIFFLKAWLSITFNKSDIVYIHYASHSSIPLFFSRRPSKLVVNVHGSDIVPNTKIQKLLNFFSKSALKKANLIVAPSSYFSTIVKDKYGISENKIFVSPSGGVDKKFFVDHKLYNSHHLTFGFVGRIEKVKGWETFIKAIKISNLKCINFIFVGGGSQENELAMEAKELTGYQISILGPLGHAKLANLYRKLDWLIFPSERESLGLVGLEAMASGTPVVASSIGGILSYAKDGYNSLLFEPNNPQLLADLLIKASRFRKEEWEIFSNNSQQTSCSYEQNHVAESLDDKLIDLYYEK